MKNALSAKIANKLKRDGIFGLFFSAMRYVYRYPKGRSYRRMLSLRSSKDKFTEIYKQNHWSSNESGSGFGSEIEYTSRLRDWLPIIISQYNIKTIVDAPCGDFNWMKLLVKKVDINYTGIDIVDDVIEKNKQKYNAEKTTFAVGDICNDKLPNCDLLIVRDCLFHLSHSDIDNFLKNIADLDYKYLLTTTHLVKSGFTNYDIETGDFRLIDLFTSPFSVDQNHVLNRVDDYPEGEPTKREMILLAKAHVPLLLQINAR